MKTGLKLLVVFLSLTWLDASTARASCRDPDVAGGFFTPAYAADNPIILRGLANYGAGWNKISTTVRDVLIYTVPVYQQQFGNALKGAAFVFDLGPVCIVHLGDLSHKLTPEQIKAFGKVDVVMIPIGGTFTMPPDTAREVLQQLKPKIAIPMHYREDMSLLGMFLTGLKSRRLPGNTLAVTKSALPPPTEIVVLTPPGGGFGRAD